MFLHVQPLEYVVTLHLGDGEEVVEVVVFHKGGAVQVS